MITAMQTCGLLQFDSLKIIYCFQIMMTAHPMGEYGVVWVLFLCYLIIYKWLKSVSLSALQHAPIHHENIAHGIPC